MKTTKASLTNAKALLSRRSLVLAFAGKPTASMQPACIRPEHVVFNGYRLHEDREDQVTPGEGAG